MTQSSESWVNGFAALLILCIFSPLDAPAATLILDFNSGLSNNAGGDLTFNGLGGFQVTFTDDDSNGVSGGDADGVHVNNINHGNIKVDNPNVFVLGAFNSFAGLANRHTSGIVATFSHGVESVSLFDTDNDETIKTLFALDDVGTLIGQTGAASMVLFSIDTGMTGGNLIHAIEFDTALGTAGGSNDSTVFTIDDFRVDYNLIPLPAAA